MDMGRGGKGVGLLAVCGHGTLCGWIRKDVPEELGAGELVRNERFQMGKDGRWLCLNRPFSCSN